ncbi:MAG: class D sortase [Bryobacteraceae bacterium]|jgi:sortase A
MSALLLLRRTQYALWAAGALLCGYYGSAHLETRLYQAMENRRLEDALRSGGASSIPAPRRFSPGTQGSPVGRLEIPRLGLSAMVLEGGDARTLRLGIGWLPETAEPGQPGNVVLGGHRDTFFRPLRDIHAGDQIALVAPGGVYRYVVQWTAVVDPADNEWLGPTPGRSLTLITCYPFYYVGPAPERFIVRARQVEPDSKDAREPERPQGIAMAFVAGWKDGQPRPETPATFPPAAGGKPAWI